MDIKKADRGILKKFIVFEGLDGAGTSTQAELLFQSMRNSQIPVHYTCEPSKSSIGTLIRPMLADLQVSSLTLAFLFAADRCNHVDNTSNGINKLCRDGITVICDRYLFSSIVYQGLDISEKFVSDLNAYFPLPHHLFFIDTNPDTAQERLSTRLNKDRYEDSKLQHPLHKRYLSVLKQYESSGMNIHYCDGSLETGELHSFIKTKLSVPI